MSGSKTPWVPGVKPSPPPATTVTPQLHTWTVGLVGQLPLRTPPGGGAAPTGPATGGPGTANAGWTPAQANPTGPPRAATTSRVTPPQPPPVDHAQVWNGRAQELATARATAQQLKTDGDPKADGLLAELSTAEQDGQAGRYQQAGAGLDTAKRKIEARALAWPVIKRADAAADKASKAGLDLGGQRDTLLKEIVDLANADKIAEANPKLAAFVTLVDAALTTQLAGGLAAAVDPPGVTPAQSQAIEVLRKKVRDALPPVSAQTDIATTKTLLAELSQAIAAAKLVVAKRTVGEGFKAGGVGFQTLDRIANLSPAQKTAIDQAIAAELSKPDADIGAIDFKTVAQAAVDHVESVAKLKPKYSNPTQAPNAAVVAKYTQADALARQSPAMKDALFKLQGSATNSFAIRIVPGSSGASCQRSSTDRAINISENYAQTLSAATLVQTIAHEAGHAQYTPGDASTAATKTQWVDKTVRNNLIDEAEATFFNCQVRKEIIAAGGADIGVAGANSAAYIATYEQFLANTLTRQQALDQIATSFGTGETTSTTNQNYDTYYRTWAAANAPGHLPP